MENFEQNFAEIKIADPRIRNALWRELLRLAKQHELTPTEELQDCHVEMRCTAVVNDWLKRAANQMAKECPEQYPGEEGRK
jgi:hypothetical protein